MYTVKLNNIKYYAFHGLFPQEAKTGNEFSVSISVSIPVELTKKNNLADLINYVSLKDIVDNYMCVKFLLLEDILGSIKEDVQKIHPEAEGWISIKKIQPPFGGRCHSSEVILSF